MIFAIDFDGTIVEHKYPYIGELKDNAKNVINRLYFDGHKIIIWTCRYLKQDLEEMFLFLKSENINFHAINTNVLTIDFKPHPKIYADIYIDDRNLFIENNIDWFKIEKYFIEKGIFQ